MARCCTPRSTGCARSSFCRAPDFRSRPSGSCAPRRPGLRGGGTRLSGDSQDGRIRLRRQRPGADRIARRRRWRRGNRSARRKPCSKPSSISTANFPWWRRAGPMARSCTTARSRTATSATFWMFRSPRPGARAGGGRDRAHRAGEAGRGRRAVRGIFPDARRRAADQRTGAAAAQLRTLHLRRLRHQPVRTATARGLRTAAGLDRADASGRDGQSAGRRVGRRHARLGGGLRISGREAASLRQGRSPAGPEDGAPHGAGRR